MTKKITFTKIGGCFLLMVSLCISSLFYKSHAETGVLSKNQKAMGGSGDTIPPVITLNGSDTVSMEVFSTYTEDGATAMDNKDGNLSAAIQYSGAVNTKVLGAYTLTYSVKDVAGNSASKTRIVIVRDTQKPVINNADANDSNIIYIACGSPLIDRTKVTDNYDTPNLIVTSDPKNPGGTKTNVIGDYILIYNATDQSGNKADTKAYTFRVADNLGPIIVLNTPDSIEWEVNVPYTPVQPTVTDACSNSSQISLTHTSNINPYKLGWYYDEYTATDVVGNKTILRRYIKVVDNEAPIITGKTLYLPLFSLNNLYVLSEGLTITDNYDNPAALQPRLILLFNNVNTYVKGLFSVAFWVSDVSGNYSKPFERNVYVGSSNTFSPLLGDDKLISIFPNPSAGIVNIVSYSNAYLEIKIYNFAGQLVSEINSNPAQNDTQTLDLSDEANGFYTLRITTEGRTINRKIFIRK